MDKPTQESPIQTSMFEEDYLLRELGQVAHVPHIALTELVANAWDAGASKVNLNIPEEVGGLLTIEDDGHGMSPENFRKRWMTLRYSREKHQGRNVEFPAGREARPRRAYGRNGIGRHGLLCFADQYEVETWREGVLGKFVVGTESGPSPFVLRNEELGRRNGSGTRLKVFVSRMLPDRDEILTVLSARFLHDPEFTVSVNGKQRRFTEIEGRVSEETLDLGLGRSATVTVIDSTQTNHSSLHQGVAFWVQKRLVGDPTWLVGSVNFDGRTRFARRYKVVVDTEGYESEVEPDWTAFRKSSSVREMQQLVAEHITNVAQRLAAEVVEAASADALGHNRSGLGELGRGARLGVAEFTRQVAQAHPTISPDFLDTAVKAVIHLEKSKSGASLLQKLSTLSAGDIEGLDHLLGEWTVKDALRVLDEIDDRLSIIETIGRLARDPNTDELHTLHPLVLRARWLFGPEFESQEYCSNATLKTIARELFKRKDAKFINERNRPDVVLLRDKTTWQLLGVESFDPSDSTITQLQNILVIELKKGGSKLTRHEINQADGYVQDIALSGAMTGNPYICAWVVGHSIDAGVERDKRLGTPEYGRVRAVTFDALVDTANRRLIKLREILSERYSGLATDQLLDRVFAEPVQEPLRLYKAGSSAEGSEQITIHES